MKKQIMESITTNMKPHLSTQQLNILENVLKKVLYNVTISKSVTEISTKDYTNEYIFKIFLIKKGSKLSTSTTEQYFRHINALLDVIQKPLTKVNTNEIEYFLLMYQKRGNSNRTVNNCRRYLSAFFSWMRKSKFINENPVESIDPYKEPVKQIEHLEPEQWEQLKTGCSSSRDRALIEFLRCTAMRDGEVPLVRISDIDWGDGKISIFGHKSSKYRLVFIDRVAKNYLSKYLDERGVDKNRVCESFSVNKVL